eukprot:2545847-Karenia_brevis.AAC.1
MHSGRTAVLERLFEEELLDIVGIQEGRTPHHEDKMAEYYRMLTSGATKAGTLGVQLWLRLAAKFRILL